jgi:hypothetical protein
MQRENMLGLSVGPRRLPVSSSTGTARSMRFMITDHGERFYEIHLPCACVLLSLRVDRGIYRVPRRRSDDPLSSTFGGRVVSCPSL